MYSGEKMKKQLIIMVGIVCFVASLLAFPTSLGDIMIKKGTYCFYPELIQIWKPVSPEMSRIIIFANPTQEFKSSGPGNGYEYVQQTWKIKFDEQYQFSIAQGYYVYVDVTPGEHAVMCKKVKKNMELEAGKTYYMEMALHPKKGEFFELGTDDVKAGNTLAKQRYVFKDPSPFNEQPAKPKAMLTGNKVLKKK
jgi:hypothetical protein